MVFFTFSIALSTFSMARFHVSSEKIEPFFSLSCKLLSLIDASASSLTDFSTAAIPALLVIPVSRVNLCVNPFTDVE